MRFIDEVSIRVYGGNGGSGAVSWRREKYLPRGGPDGGDGGNGGAVIFETDPGLNTLIDISFNPEIRAESGGSGEANARTGRSGADRMVRLPVGTQVFYHDKLAADLDTPSSRWIAARGGRGGKGNLFFKSATNQSPDFAQPGRAGEAREFRLILKSVADVGVVGLPNVGKSTLVSSISKAQPKIADYPFTTLAPSLGVVLVDDERRFVIADIPGLIPGAHEGKGLGVTFLQHIERTSVLAHLIDVSLEIPAETGTLDDEQLSISALRQFELIDRELELFSPVVHAKPRLVVFSKADLEVSRSAFSAAQAQFERLGLETVLISSSTGEGLDLLKERLARKVQEERAAGFDVVPG